MSDQAVTKITKPSTLGEAKERAASVPMQHVGAGTFLPDFGDMKQVMEFASLMAGAGVMVGHAVRGNPGACMATTMIAARFNLDPFMLSTKAYITKNKAGVEVLAWEAQAIVAMIQGSGVLETDLDYEYSGKGVERQVRVFGRLKGATSDREILTNKIKDIKVKNSPLWVSEPDQQLAYYGSRLWVRRHAPSVLMGIYSPDELDPNSIRNITPTNDVEDPAQRLQARVSNASPPPPAEPPVEEVSQDDFEVDPTEHAQGELIMDQSPAVEPEDVIEPEPEAEDSGPMARPNLIRIDDPTMVNDKALTAWADAALPFIKRGDIREVNELWTSSLAIIAEIEERLPNVAEELNEAIDYRAPN